MTGHPISKSLNLVEATVDLVFVQDRTELSCMSIPEYCQESLYHWSVKMFADGFPDGPLRKELQSLGANRAMFGLNASRLQAIASRLKAIALDSCST